MSRNIRHEEPRTHMSVVEWVDDDRRRVSSRNVLGQVPRPACVLRDMYVAHRIVVNCILRAISTVDCIFVASFAPLSRQKTTVQRGSFRTKCIWFGQKRRARRRTAEPKDIAESWSLEVSSYSRSCCFLALQNCVEMRAMIKIHRHHQRYSVLLHCW